MQDIDFRTQDNKNYGWLLIAGLLIAVVCLCIGIVFGTYMSNTSNVEHGVMYRSPIGIFYWEHPFVRAGIDPVEEKR